MQRTEIAARLLGPDSIPLWVPLLTHYRRDNGAAVVDTDRMARHMAQVRPSVRSWMLAGSTGDGWDISAEQFDVLLAFAAGSDFGPDVRVLIGALRATTDEVIALVEKTHAAAGTSASATLEENVDRLARIHWVGLTVCPPVGENVSQDDILDHYRAVIAAARMPLAVYQLPQVTGNTIAPATMAKLAAEYPEIILFKDSSGEDVVAESGVDLGGVVRVRGAEGDYAEVLAPLGGPYDGWLLSTGNAFGPHLRKIARAVSDGAADDAKQVSAELTERVNRLFTAGADAPVGNAFANVNRAVDHVLAHGAAWRDHETPMLFDGSRLPTEIVAKIAVILDAAGCIPEKGYL
jgi:dihydrodipicolinate synthase/N-acetylneuraminate lyase